MLSTARRHPLVLVLLLAFVLLPIGCGDSNPVTGPSATMGGPAPAASLSGTWSGTYMSYDPSGCGGSTATATLQQNGATFTGFISTSTCGVTGYLKGQVQGNMVTGAVSMEGCVGGGASGTVSGSDLVLSIGDLTKPLISGDKVLMYGGTVSFHR